MLPLIRFCHRLLTSSDPYLSLSVYPFFFIRKNPAGMSITAESRCLAPFKAKGGRSDSPTFWPIKPLPQMMAQRRRVRLPLMLPDLPLSAGPVPLLLPLLVLLVSFVLFVLFKSCFSRSPQDSCTLLQYFQCTYYPSLNQYLYQKLYVQGMFFSRI